MTGLAANMYSTVERQHEKIDGIRDELAEVKGVAMRLEGQAQLAEERRMNEHRIVMLHIANLRELVEKVDGEVEHTSKHDLQKLEVELNDHRTRAVGSTTYWVRWVVGVVVALITGGAIATFSRMLGK